VTNSIPRPTVAVNTLTDISHRPIACHTKTRGQLLLLLPLKAYRPIFNRAGKRPLGILILQMVVPTYPFEIYVEGKKPQERKRAVGFEPTTSTVTTPLWTPDNTISTTAPSPLYKVFASKTGL